MTRKEKAKKLVNKFLKSGMTIEPAKRCAFICVDEILEELTLLHHKTPLIFWNEVKKEIKKL